MGGSDVECVEEGSQVVDRILSPRIEYSPEVLSLAREGLEFLTHSCEWPLALNPILVLREQVTDRDLDRLTARKEVLHEEVAAGSKQATLLDLLTPEWIVESSPVLLVERFLRLAPARRAQEDEVAEEVGGQERFASRVEGLEDDLGVIARFQVDGHHLQRVLERAEALDQSGLERGLDRQGLVPIAAEEVRPQLVVQEDVRFYHPRSRIGLASVLLVRDRVQGLKRDARSR